MLVRHTRELIEDISAILSLLSTVDHTGVDQYAIHNYEKYGDKHSAMADAMIMSLDPVWRRSLWKRGFLMRRWRIRRRSRRN